MFPLFPYSNFHRLNADWILKKVQELATAVEQMADEVSSWASRITQAETDAAHAVKFTNQQLTQNQQDIARSNIGAAPRIGVVYYNEAMALSDNYKTQARTNIGAAASTDVPVSAVLYTEQSLTAAQQAQARANIGAGTGGGSDNAVLYTEQSLTSAQQTQARANIGAADAQLEQTVSDLDTSVYNLSYTVGHEVVHTTAQTIPAAQQTQARANIGAAASADVPAILNIVHNATDNPDALNLMSQGKALVYAQTSAGTNMHLLDTVNVSGSTGTAQYVTAITGGNKLVKLTAQWLNNKWSITTVDVATYTS